MKKNELLQVGDPMLRKRSRRIVEPQSAATQLLIKRLIKIMREYDLVGISAPQIGIPKRVYVSEVRKTHARPQVIQEALCVYINPSIVAASSQKKSLYEGCGSVLAGALFARVSRHTWVTIAYADENGVPQKKTLRGLSAQIAQHEIDHLDGILFLDRVSDTSSYTTKELFRKKQYTR